MMKRKFSTVLIAISLGACQPPPPIVAGWETYTVPGGTRGYAREQIVVKELDRRAKETLGGDEIASLRETGVLGDSEANYSIIASAISKERAVYLYAAYPYNRITGMIGPEVQICKVDITLASLPEEKTHDGAMRVADDIFRNGDCKADAPRSEEYYRLKAEQTGG